MAKYTVKEDGNNGSVEIDGDDIVRTHEKRLARDDEVRIPLRTVSSVKVDRQIGGDVVEVSARDAEYEWKLSDDDAERFAAEIRSRIDS